MPSVRGGMPKLTFASTAIVLGLVLVACSSAAGPSSRPTGGPDGSPGATAPPSGSGVDHGTGATDVVLRMEEGGGFVPIEFAASGAPIFTLYGDGRIVFQQLSETFPEPGPDGITRASPWHTAQLDEGQIEELLTFALGPGGIGAARDMYIDNGIMDAPNTIFTVNAGGLKKIVTVNALGMDPTGGPDDGARAQFKKLADRLRDFDDGGTIASDVYVPTNYRAVLIEREVDPAIPGPSPTPWPWPDLSPADFPEGDGTSGPGFPHRTLSAEEVATLNLGDAFGGAQGLIVRAPNDKTYTVILRPLLPDES
jgi:hypothetical protein